MTSSTVCPVCKSAGFRVAVVGRDRSRGHTGTFQIVECLGCGVLYLVPPVSREEAAHDYQDTYRLTPGWKRFLRSQRFRRRIGRIEQALLRFTPGGDLLDVGSGSGDFLYGMLRSGRWNLQGLEMNPCAAAFTRETFGIPVYTGMLEEVLPPHARFDVITLWEVFEHLQNPISALKRLRSALKSKGVLVIKTPNPDSFAARLFGSCWCGWDMPRHYLIWRPSVFKKFVEEQDLKVVEAKPLFGEYAAFLTSLGFTLQGWLPKEILRAGLRVLSEVPFEWVGTPTLRKGTAMKRSSSMTYFIQGTQ